MDRPFFPPCWILPSSKNQSNFVFLCPLLQFSLFFHLPGCLMTIVVTYFFLVQNLVQNLAQCGESSWNPPGFGRVITSTHFFTPFSITKLELKFAILFYSNTWWVPTIAMFCCCCCFILCFFCRFVFVFFLFQLFFI